MKKPVFRILSIAWILCCFSVLVGLLVYAAVRGSGVSVFILFWGGIVLVGEITAKAIRTISRPQ